jgi:hypothetical protein
MQYLLHSPITRIVGRVGVANGFRNCLARPKHSIRPQEHDVLEHPSALSYHGVEPQGRTTQLNHMVRIAV